MLFSLEGLTLGVWISYGEGNKPYTEDKYNIVAKYVYDGLSRNQMALISIQLRYYRKTFSYDAACNTLLFLELGTLSRKRSKRRSFSMVMKCLLMLENGLKKVISGITFTYNKQFF